MGVMAMALRKANMVDLPEIEDQIVVRVKRCYNAGSDAEALFQRKMALIVKAYRLGKITEDQARALAQSL